jgi:hypothetical protein
VPTRNGLLQSLSIDQQPRSVYSASVLHRRLEFCGRAATRRCHLCAAACDGPPNHRGPHRTAYPYLLYSFASGSAAKSVSNYTGVATFQAIFSFASALRASAVILNEQAMCLLYPRKGENPDTSTRFQGSKMTPYGPETVLFTPIWLPSLPKPGRRAGPSLFRWLPEAPIAGTLFHMI